MTDLNLFEQDADVDVSSTDSVGFETMESSVQSMKIAMMYLDFADSGAASINITFKNENNQELRITEYISSGKAKGCKTFYLNKNGKKVALPGWSKINDLCLAATELGFGKQTVEEKTIEVWNSKAKKKLPKKCKVFMSLLNTTVKIGVLKLISDKTVDSGELDDKGKKIYLPTGETRTSNEADKFFNETTDLTPAEVATHAKNIKAGKAVTGSVAEAKFIKTWSKKWIGKVKDTSTKVEGVQSGAPVAGAGTAGLFPA